MKCMSCNQIHNEYSYAISYNYDYRESPICEVCYQQYSNRIPIQWKFDQIIRIRELAEFRNKKDYLGQALCWLDRLYYPKTDYEWTQSSGYFQYHKTLPTIAGFEWRNWKIIKQYWLMSLQEFRTARESEDVWYMPPGGRISKGVTPNV